jgi:hypothetical protein
MPTYFRLIAGAAALFAFAACGGDNKPAPETPSKSAEADDRSPAPGQAQAGDVKTVEGKKPGDERYALTIEAPAAEAGKEAQVVVRVVPKNPWHMNLEYPTSLKIDPPQDVALAKAELKKDDAELTEEKCEFDVKFTPAKAGEQTFTGKFKFAVCQEQECSPVTEDVEFKVAVK